MIKHTKRDKLKLKLYDEFDKPVDTVKGDAKMLSKRMKSWLKKFE